MLEIIDLKKSFREPSGNQISILDVPIFSMKAAEQVVLRGESGCGKTTLLHTISGLLDCDSGSIKLDGIELTKYSEAARDRIRADKLGYVFQTFNLLPAFTALENVKLGMTFARKTIRSERATELLSRVGLKDRMHYLPSQLSVGQQQRVAIIRALLQPFDLLLMDEPFTGVDATTQEVTFGLLDHLREKQVTTIISTHDLNLAATRFDLVLLINHRLIAFGTPQQVFTKENLASAFGNSLLVMENGMMLVDECCPPDEEHHHIEVK